MLRQLNKVNLVRPNFIPFMEAGWHTNGPEAWDAYIWTEQIDELYAAFKQKEVNIIRELQTASYGNREFEIQDINNYVLCFGEIQRDQQDAP